MSGEQKPTVVELLLRVMSDVQSIGKRDRNTEQGYSFRGIDATVNAVGPALRAHGVLVLPMLESASYRDVLTVREKRSRECTVQVRYRFYGPAGDHVDAVVPGESMDFGDKGAAKAMSVAYRIALLQALCIPTDEPEPDAQSYERAGRGEWDAARPRPAEPAAIRAEIAREGQGRGLGLATIAADFTAWSQGVEIQTCNDARLLGEYLAHMRGQNGSAE